MARATRFIGGKYMTTAMIREMSEKDRLCKIDHVAEEHISGTAKLVVYTDKHDMGVPLNTSRIEQLIEHHGGDDDTDKWRGTQIRLTVDESVRFQGKRVGGISIELVEK